MVWLVGFLVVLLVVAAVAVGAAVMGGRKVVGKVTESYARGNQVVPGIPTAAPPSWLGAHHPEAKLHRRLIDAIKALRASQDHDALGQYLDLRVEIEQRAVAIDNELVATSKLPENLRTEPLEQLSAGVAAVEEAVAEIGRAGVAGATGGLEEMLAKVRERTSSLGQAREALEALEREQSGDLGTSSGPSAAGGAPVSELLEASDPGSQPGTSPG